MRTNMICQPGPWMGRRRFAPLAAGALALMTAWAGTPAWADEAPSLPAPSIVRPTLDDPRPYMDVPPPYLVAVSIPAAPAVPEEVQAAISTLARACAAWPAPQPHDGFPRFSQPSTTLPQRVSVERNVCDIVTSPTSFASELAWFFGIFGAMALALGLVGFCFLRAVLVMAWNWRPRSMARMQ